MPRDLSRITGIKQDARTFKPEPSLACDQTLVGIEVEIENASEFNTHSNKLRFWSEVGERSLRNSGAEYVTPPIQGADILTAMDELRKHVASLQRMPTVGERTGLHVHIDCRDSTLQSLYRFIVVYTIFEKYLFSKCEEGRDGNAYCVPLSDCQDLLVGMKKLLSPRDVTSRSFLNNYPKYTAINLKPLLSLGTVEIRMHEGTYDADVILHWVNLLLSIKRYAENSEDSPQQLVDAVCADPENYFADVFKQFGDGDFTDEVYAGMLSGARAAQFMYRVKEVPEVAREETLLHSLYSKETNEAEAKKAPSVTVSEQYAAILARQQERQARFSNEMLGGTEVPTNPFRTDS